MKLRMDRYDEGVRITPETEALGPIKVASRKGD
jgi:hypothetical protein